MIILTSKRDNKRATASNDSYSCHPEWFTKGMSTWLWEMKWNCLSCKTERESKRVQRQDIEWRSSDRENFSIVIIQDWEDLDKDVLKESLLLMLPPSYPTEMGVKGQMKCKKDSSLELLKCLGLLLLLMVNNNNKVYAFYRLSIYLDTCVSLPDWPWSLSDTQTKVKRARVRRRHVCHTRGLDTGNERAQQHPQQQRMQFRGQSLKTFQSVLPFLRLVVVVVSKARKRGRKESLSVCNTSLLQQTPSIKECLHLRCFSWLSFLCLSRQQGCPVLSLKLIHQTMCAWHAVYFSFFALKT